MQHDKGRFAALVRFCAAARHGGFAGGEAHAPSRRGYAAPRSREALKNVCHEQRHP
jgi:hypothetical protein